MGVELEMMVMFWWVVSDCICISLVVVVVELGVIWMFVVVVVVDFVLVNDLWFMLVWVIGMIIE